MATNHDSKNDSALDGSLAHDARAIGVDGGGAEHYWSMYERTIYVVEDGELEDAYELAETPYDTLSDWARHVTAQRGLWRDLRIQTDAIDVDDYVADGLGEGI